MRRLTSVGVARRSGAINTVNAPFNCALPRMARASLSAARCARCTLPQTCGWVQTRRSVWGSRPIAVLSKVAPQFPLTPGPAPRTGAGSAASQLGCAVRRSRAGTLAGMSVFPGHVARETSVHDGKRVSDPLRGCRCFRVMIPITIVALEQGFRPLAGMSVFPGHNVGRNYAASTRFQTPCGDVGVSGRIRFSLPPRDVCVGFRPLAGMSVFPGVHRLAGAQPRREFQTPCGDVGVSGTESYFRY